MDVVHVMFSGSARSRPCAAGGLDLESGDGCVVETERGFAFGIVTQATLSDPFHERGEHRLLRVVRRATRDDEEAYAHQRAREKEARDYCVTRIAERGLPMKLGRVERQLDGKKMTFFFTAAGRVDFRDLVRDLAARFRTRVELRQIGSRDDASMHGGCGPCGRMLCCSRFLGGFEPISIRMAKQQGLSLNPAKISGMCGRLMCCLKYEYRQGKGPRAKNCDDCPNGRKRQRPGPPA